MVKHLFALPESERILHFRELAALARRFAEGMQAVSTREAYLKIAEHWERLARELEAARDGDRDAA